jgi:diadenosine tetraphosphate (Ap4A) HIT family hydrolase
MESTLMEPTCFACQTIAGTNTAPGGVVYENDDWLADHCIGAFGVGAIVLKTKAHRANLWDLTSEETESLGKTMRLLSEAIVHALGAERVYVSLWVDQPPYHVHFVLQPRYPEPAEWSLKGWRLQLMRHLQGTPDADQMAEAAQKVRNYLQNLEGKNGDPNGLYLR